MNKLPAKQIYLLLVIIVGIIALSVYSTYAIFTFESETSDIVSINLPSALEIKTEMYEYKQVEIPANSVNTTDVDIYNTFDYELCYSIWYNIVDDDALEEYISVYSLDKENLSTSGIVKGKENSRFSLLVVNDNGHPVSINLGLATVKETSTCSMNLTDEKKLVKNIYEKDVYYFGNKLTEEAKNVKTSEEGYLTYKNIDVDISFSEEIVLANNFSYVSNKFSLVNPITVKINDLEKVDYKRNNYYICSDDECNIVYRINDAELLKIELDDEIVYEYNIKNVDKLEGYAAGKSGLKKINNDYYFYGSNPDNFVYYNCDEKNKCELWRIVGLIYNKESKRYHVKLVKNDSIGKYQYNTIDDDNSWVDSSLYIYLNDDYEFIDSNDRYVGNVNYDILNISSIDSKIIDIKKDNIISKDKTISILNLNDYIYSTGLDGEKISDYSSYFVNSWLNRVEIANEWLLTLKRNDIKEATIEETTIEEEVVEEDTLLDDENTDDEELIVEDESIVESDLEYIKKVYKMGSMLVEDLPSSYADVRPVIYLKDRVLLYDGDGTIDNPYVIR